jgi:hypothetical protein
VLEDPELLEHRTARRGQDLVQEALQEALLRVTDRSFNIKIIELLVRAPRTSHPAVAGSKRGVSAGAVAPLALWFRWHWSRRHWSRWRHVGLAPRGCGLGSGCGMCAVRGAWRCGAWRSGAVEHDANVLWCLALWCMMLCA